MIDCGSSQTWRPSIFIRNTLRRTVLDYLFITNADQDHLSDLKGLEESGVRVDTFIRNRSYTGAQLQALKLVGGPLSADADWYIGACDTFSMPTNKPFDQHMGGISCQMF
jgi:hypothetical protein